MSSFGCSIGSSGVENDNLRAHLTRLNAGLMRMMIPIAMFAKAEDLCDCKANRDFSIVAVQFLCDPELQGDAVDLLLIITRHKLPFDVFSRLVETIPRLSSSLLQPTPPATAGGSSLPADILECLTFQRTYAEMVFSLLCENISQATDRFYLQSIPNAQEILGNYVMLMANLIGQSSRRLAGDVAKEWTKIFREDSIANIPWMSDVCVVLLNVYTSKMERIIWEKEIVTCGDLEIMNITPLDETAAAEFNDYDEWMDFAGALKTQVKNLCSVLAVKFPKVCVSFLETRCRYLISRPSMAVKGDPNDAEDVMQWQAFGIILEALSSKLVPSDISISNEINVQVMGQLYVIIDLLLSWTPPSHSVLLLQRLQCFHNCSAVLRSAPKELIQRVFADLFGHDSLILSTAPLSVSTSIVTPAQLSEKASAVIAHLCHYCGEAVTLDSTLLNAIVSQVNK